MEEIQNNTKDKSDILLSIIIPHYNRPLMLRKLLLSIPDKPWIQVIVIDDKSTKYLDAYAAVKTEFIAERGYLFLDNPDKSTGSARNYGLGFAVGEWLIFADSDDYFTEDFEKIVTRHLNDTEDLIYFEPVSENLDAPEKTGIRHIRYKKLVEDYILSPNLRNEYLIRYIYWISMSKMIRRKLVQDNNILFAHENFCEDFIFSAKCGGYAKKMKATKESFYCITEHGDSMTRVDTLPVQQIRYREYLKYVKWIKSHVGLKGIIVMGRLKKYIHVMLAQHKRRLIAFITGKEEDKGWVV